MPNQKQPNRKVCNHHYKTASAHLHNNKVKHIKTVLLCVWTSFAYICCSCNNKKNYKKENFSICHFMHMPWIHVEYQKHIFPGNRFRFLNALYDEYRNSSFLRALSGWRKKNEMRACGWLIFWVTSLWRRNWKMHSTRQFRYFKKKIFLVW